MDKSKRAFTAREHRRSLNRSLAVAAARPADLYAALYEQTQQVLGRTCGFYMVTVDPDRELVRLAYLVDEEASAQPGDTFALGECDVVSARAPLMNDEFARKVSACVASSIGVPMIRNNTVWGAFGAFTREERAYDTRDAKALAALAEMGALVLENASFVNEIQQAQREAERLEEIGRAITASLDLSQVLKRVVNAALELIGADAATVWLVRAENEVEAAMSAGEIAPRVGQVLHVPPAIRRRMTELRRPFLLYDDAIRPDRNPFLVLPRVGAAASSMAIALIADDDVLGALSIAHKQRVEYTPEDIRLLERLSFQAAIAVANARLHERLHALSLTDPLTEIPNRRHLAFVLEKEFAGAKRGRQLSLLIFDLDNFKQYNDRKGHQAGDAVLRAFARLLREHSRAVDLAARYGGDEFVVVLGDTDREGASAHAGRILSEMANDPVLATAAIRTTVGIAVYDSNMSCYEDLIRAADHDLYAHKSLPRRLA